MDKPYSEGNADCEGNGRVIEKESKSFCYKVKNFLSNVTVEPLLALYLMPGVLGRLAVSNLNLEKACRVNLNYSNELCNNISMQILNKSNEEREVQEVVSYMESWTMAIHSVIPCLLILFVGAWSDRTRKRKPCFMVPLSGEIITQLGLILCTYYFVQWPMEVAGFVEAIPPAITGGAAAMFLGVYSYITDVTTPEDRTFRIGVMNTFVSVAQPIGQALSGILLKTIGFYGIFLICLSFHLTALIYGYFRIHDVKVPKEDQTGTLPEDAVAKKSWGCGKFFDLKLIYETFHVLFKKRESSKRKQTILLVLAYVLLNGASHGASGRQYYYARYAYQFDEVDFSYFGSYAVVTNLVGVMLAVTVLSKYMKMNDYMLAFLACCSKILASFLYALAPNKYWFYLGPLIELIGGTAVIAMRSVVTKLVDPYEIGKINSVMGLTESAVNVVYIPMFGTFYALTLSVYPGAFCLLGAALTLPSTAILLYLYKLQKKENKEKNLNELQNMNSEEKGRNDDNKED